MLLDQIHPDDEVGRELLAEFNAACAVSTEDELMKVQLGVKMKGVGEGNAPMFREAEFQAPNAALVPLAKITRHLRVEYAALVLEPVHAMSANGRVRHVAVATDDILYINVLAQPVEDKSQAEEDRRRRFRSTSG